MVTLVDPRTALQEARNAKQEPSSRDIIGAAVRAPEDSPGAIPDEPAVAAIKADFRVFLSLVWRFRLNCNPSPDQLALAYYLQHGPSRSIIMAFRGMSKSWITDCYALWLLYRDPQLKVLIVSGSLKLSVANATFCLQLIMTMPLLSHLMPKPTQRQSTLAFDVGPALSDPTPSFHASGIGGQIVGFRGDCIIADDVETQTNSLTVDSREKLKEAVKEFESIIKPGGQIKYLGTPHDADSLYVELYTKRSYQCRVWPALYPTREQEKVYEDRLHPYVTHRLTKDPSLVGTPIQPGRFTLDDLNGRLLRQGKSEFALQFMLDTSLSDVGKYPLKYRDLIVMDLDLKKGPESVTWGTSHRVTDLPLLGFSGDYYHAPIEVSDRFAKWETITAFVDPSGRGKDETAMTVVAGLFGHVALLFNRGWTDGAAPETLKGIAEACVRYNVEVLEVEDNFGDGMFTSLLRPVVTAAWKKQEEVEKKGGRLPVDRRFGTSIENVKSTNQMAKERRMLQVLEPVTQQHRLIVAREVIEADERSLLRIEGEDTRRAYSLLYQYAHLTRDRDSLKHDDRLESLAGALMRYAPMLGVDPGTMAQRATSDRVEEELEKLLGEIDELGGKSATNLGKTGRIRALSPSKR